MDPDKQGAQTGQHRWTQQPFPSRILPGSQREGCYNYCYHGMEKWVCDSSDERLLTIALLFSCWLPGSSPSLVQGSHLPALPQAICTNIPFLLASPSHTSQHLTTLPCYMVQPWPHTQAAQFSITDISRTGLPASHSPPHHYFYKHCATCQAFPATRRVA